VRDLQEQGDVERRVSSSTRRRLNTGTGIAANYALRSNCGARTALHCEHGAGGVPECRAHRERLLEFRRAAQIRDPQRRRTDHEALTGAPSRSSDEPAFDLIGPAEESPSCSPKGVLNTNISVHTGHSPDVADRRAGRSLGRLPRHGDHSSSRTPNRVCGGSYRDNPILAGEHSGAPPGRSPEVAARREGRSLPGVPPPRTAH
jgi:hypothetical protein